MMLINHCCGLILCIGILGWYGGEYSRDFVRGVVVGNPPGARGQPEDLAAGGPAMHCLRCGLRAFSQFNRGFPCKSHRIHPAVWLAEHLQHQSEH